MKIFIFTHMQKIHAAATGDGSSAKISAKF